MPGGTELLTLDVSDNFRFKQHLTRQFEQWYADQVAAALSQDEEPKVDVRMSTMKPLHARWLVAAIDELRSTPDELIYGWVQTGIKAAVDPALAPEDEVSRL